MPVVHPYTEKTEGGRLLHCWYNVAMEIDTKYTVFVMQSEINPKDVYIAQTTKDPTDVVTRYNSTQNPKTLPKPLGSMLPLILRPDLVDDNNVFMAQSDAIEYRKILSENIERQNLKFNLRSKRSYFFGMKKSTKDKNTGKYKLNLDPTLFQTSESSKMESNLSRGDVHSYGRKKSAEWNDEVAAKFEESLKEKAKKQLDDKDR